MEFRSSIHENQTVYENTPCAEATPVFLKRAIQTNSGMESLASHEHIYHTQALPNRNVRIYLPGFFSSEMRYSTMTASLASLACLIPLRCGDRVYASWNQQSGRWETASPLIETLRFVLTTTFSHSISPNWQTASAEIVIFNSNTNSYETSGVAITVVDFLNKYQNAIGSFGYARRFSDLPSSGFWEIFQM